MLLATVHEFVHSNALIKDCWGNRHQTDVYCYSDSLPLNPVEKVYDNVYSFSYHLMCICGMIRKVLGIEPLDWEFVDGDYFLRLHNE